MSLILLEWPTQSHSNSFYLSTLRQAPLGTTHSKETFSTPEALLNKIYLAEGSSSKSSLTPLLFPQSSSSQDNEHISFSSLLPLISLFSSTPSQNPICLYPAKQMSSCWPKHIPTSPSS